MRGQQRIARLHQGLDPRCRMVKALRQKAHFIFALGCYAHTQLALAPALYARLQVFQATRQPPHYRISGQCHCQSHQGQGAEKTQRRKPAVARRTRQMQVHGLTVLQLHNKFGSPAKSAARLVILRILQTARRPKWRRMHAPCAATAYHIALGVAHHHLAQRWLRIHAPGHANQKGQYGHREHHGGPDADVEFLKKHDARYLALSPAGGQRHSRRRAPSECGGDF